MCDVVEIVKQKLKTPTVFILVLYVIYSVMHLMYFDIYIVIFYVLIISKLLIESIYY